MTTPTEPAPEPTPPTHIVIAGWQVPIELIPPFAEAMRWKYPDVALTTAPDDVAMQDALLWFAVNILEEYRVFKANEALLSSVAAVEREFASRREGARRHVHEQAKRIVRDTPEQPAPTELTP